MLSTGVALVGQLEPRWMWAGRSQGALVGWLELRQAWARHSQATLHKGHFGRIAGAKAGIARRSQTALYQGCPSKPSGAEVTWAWSVPGCCVPVSSWSDSWSHSEH